MKIHEYQGKEVLASYGVPVPKGRVAFSPEEAVAAGRELGFPVVVKAQIHAGGRGKGGGVAHAKSVWICRRIVSRIAAARSLRSHPSAPISIQSASSNMPMLSCCLRPCPPTSSMVSPA